MCVRRARQIFCGDYEVLHLREPHSHLPVPRNYRIYRLYRVLIFTPCGSKLCPQSAKLGQSDLICCSVLGVCLHLASKGQSDSKPDFGG